MSKDALSDESRYSALETVINTILQEIPLENQETSSFPDKSILKQLQQQGHNLKTSWAFLRACYWYLTGKRIMIVDPSLRYHLTEKMTEDTKTDLCMKIFSEYEKYLQANYARSLIDPDPYHKPEKAPDGSLGFLPRSHSSGGK